MVLKPELSVWKVHITVIFLLQRLITDDQGNNLARNHE